MAKIRNGLAFMHAGIHQDMDPRHGNEVEKAEPGDHHAIASAEQVGGLEGGFSVHAGQAVHVRLLPEEGVMKRHAPPDDGRKRIVRKKRAPARAMHVDRDRRGDLVRPENDGKRSPEAARRRTQMRRRIHGYLPQSRGARLTPGALEAAFVG